MGPAGRTAFLVALAEREILRQRQLKIFANKEPIWKDEDHPEFINGDSDAWVRQLRQEDDKRP